MSLKHIARYRSQHTGNTVEEEMRWLKVRSEINYESLFGADIPITYERYEWQKKNNRLRGEK